MSPRRLRSFLFAFALLLATQGCTKNPQSAPEVPAAPKTAETKLSPTPVDTPPPAASATPPAAPVQPLRIVGQFPLPGDAVTDRFVLYFSDRLVAPADATGQPIDALSSNPPVKFELTLKDNYLAARFDPASVARPASYTVSLNPGLRGAGGGKHDGSAPFTFNLPAPDGAFATGLDLAGRSSTELRLRLKFNLAMNIDALKEKMRVTDATGAEQAFTLAPTDGAANVDIVIAGEPKFPISVTVFAGAPDKSGTTPLSTAAAFTFPSAGNETLRVGEFRRTAADKDKITFQIAFSRAMDMAVVQQALAVSDAGGQAVAITLRPASEGAQSNFQFDVPAGTKQPLHVRLPKGLRAGDQIASLGAEQTYEYPQPLLFKDASWSVEQDGGHKIDLSFTEAVVAASLKPLLNIKAKDSGAPLKFDVGSGTSSVVSVRLLDVPAEVKDILVEVQPGLSAGALNVMTERSERSAHRQALPLGIEYADWEMRGKDGALIRLDVNQAVDLPSMQRAVSFDPPVANISVSSTWTRGLTISGDFASKTSYTLHVSKQATSPAGDGLVADDMSYPLNESPVAKGAGFDFEDKFYYPRRTAGVVPLQTRNIDTVDVKLSQLFPSNVQVALSSIEDGKTWSDFETRWAKSIAEKKISVKNTPDKKVTLPLDLKELMPPDTRGVFGLTLSPGSNSYETKIVVWTNIGLLAHWVNDEIVIFAHDLFTLAPIENARVTVWSAKNQLMIGSKTNAQGVAVLRGLDKALGTPDMVVAELDNDFTFLRLAPRTDDAVPVTESMPAYDRKGYDAFLYADRELYRPGEVVHAHWIARTNFGDALANVPLQFEIINPRGSKLQTQSVQLSALGTGGLDVQTDRSWMTGKYSLNLLVPGSKTPVGSMQINIEDFVPNRIKTEVGVAASQWMVREPQKITVKAENLFGGPAANRKAGGNVILRKGNLELPELKGFSFSNDVDYLPEVLPLGDAETDAQGIANFDFTWQGSPRVSFPVKAVVRGEVSELGGRAVSDTKEVTLFASNKLIGVNVAKSANSNAVEINVAAVTPAGAPAEVSSVKVLLEREDWSYYVRRYASYNEPKFTKSYLTVHAKEVPIINGRGSVTLDLPEYSWGYFRVRVSSSTTPMIATQAFYKNWNGIELADTPRPSLIKLVLDKEKYEVGGSAHVRIESPFDGRAVVVVQGDTFYQVLTTEVKDGAGEVVVPLDKNCAPNVWAEATVVHVAPKDRTQVYPYSSFAMINIPVQDPARRIDVAFPALPEEVRPAQEIEVALETKGSDGAPIGAELTVAAVDEGIHNILGYDNPDPWNFLQRPRKPDYRRANYYDRVAYDFSPEAIGGDLAARLSKRSTTIGDNWIKPVALWSGTVNTGADGKGSVKFSVPEFNGQLRLVAVAASPTATGATAKNLYVRRPYILQTSLPRFALPGDTFSGRANVFNTSGAAVTARISWTTSGTITGGPGGNNIEVAAGKDASALAEFKAAEAVGQGNILWKAEIVDAGGKVLDTLTQDMPLPVRPPAAYQSHNEFAVLKPGETKTFENTRFVDDDQVELQLTVGNDPALRISRALKQVVGYPYGCVEQTTSRCLPLYLLRKSTALVESTLAENQRVDAMIKAGIDRLFSMQTSSGGLGYWPGATEPNRYGSVYALHFLAFVQRERELPVPEENFKALQKYVRLVGNETSDESDSGLYLRAYAHYVLAITGDAEALKQIERFDAIDLPSSARYLLAAALAMNTNDPARVQKYLASKPAHDFTERERAGTLNSEIRDTAVKLLALVQMKADEKELAPRLDALTRFLAEQRYPTTQESAFVCAALGMYLNQFSQNPAESAVSISSPEGETTLQNGKHAVLRHSGAKGKFTLNNTGKSAIYVNFASAGLPLKPEEQASSEGVKITRTVQTAGRAAKEDATFAQGDTYVVQLDIDSETSLENLILVDLLPAGFEIENPRLDAQPTEAAAGDAEGENAESDEGGESEESSESGETADDGDISVSDDSGSSATPNYLDVRDDRLVLAFNNLPSGPHTYYYLVRAVTPGTFQQPGATAECMYDAKARANTAAGKVEVK